jgi:hypothetical protein
VLAVDRQFDVPQVQYPLALNLGDVVGLVGYDVSNETLQREQPLDITLYWQSLTATDLPLKVFVHLVGPDNVIYDQRDLQPRNYTYPVSLWVAGEYIEDSYTLIPPAHAPSGVYTIRVGMYVEENNLRLQIQDENQVSQGDMWTLVELALE